MSADTFVCGIVTCLRATASGCTGGDAPACRCRIGSQYGPSCGDNRWLENPSVFYAFYSTMLVLFLGLTAFGAFVFYFYLARFRPRLPQKPSLLNPHFIAILAISLGCFFRLIYSIIGLAAGPRFELLYFKPSALQVFVRLMAGLIYPLVAMAYTIQVLMWMDLLFKTKTMKAGQSRWIWIVFTTLMIVLFSLEFITAMLLNFRVSAKVVVFMYRAIMGMYCLFLCGVAAIFGVRFIIISGRDANNSLASARAAASKRNLNRMVMLTGCTFFIAVILAVILFVVPPTSAAGFFVPEWSLYVMLVILSAGILLVFFTMMRNRMMAMDEGTESTLESNHAGELSKPLMEAIEDNDNDEENNEL